MPCLVIYGGGFGANIINYKLFSLFFILTPDVASNSKSVAFFFNLNSKLTLLICDLVVILPS